MKDQEGQGSRIHFRRRAFFLLAAVLFELVPASPSSLSHIRLTSAATPLALTEYNTPTAGSGADDVAAPNGYVWFSEYNVSKIAKISMSGVVTEYTIPTSSSGPEGITVGPDGNIWFAEHTANKIGKFNPNTTTFTEYSVPTTNSGPEAITTGSDGNLWFTEDIGGAISQITTSGSITEYSVSSLPSLPGAIASSPTDGNLYFTDNTYNIIGQFNPSTHAASKFTVPTSNSVPAQLTVASDGTVWFVEHSGNNVGELVPSTSTFSEWAIPTASSGPWGITVGPDGNMWFTEGSGNNVGQFVRSTNAINEYSVPTSSSTPGQLVRGSDNNVWFTEFTGSKMGRLTPAPLGAAITDAQTRTGSSNGCVVCSFLHNNATTHPVDTENGNFWHTFQDVLLPGRGITAEVDRTYNSDDASSNGPLGYGWTFNYGMSLAVSGTSPNQVATITQENDSQVTFNQPSSGSIWPAAAPRFVATLTYNSGSSTWTLQRDGQNKYTFNSSGQLTQEQDLNGYTTALAYSSGNLSTVTDNAGRTLGFTWTGSHITKVTDSNVSGNTRTVSYSFNGSGELTDVTDVNGGDTNFTYASDGSHRITVMKDPVCEALGSSCPGVQNHYNSSGQVDWQKDQLNRQTSFSYTGTPLSGSGGTTTITDPASHEVLDSYVYGALVSETRGYGSSAAATTKYLYDPTTMHQVGIVDPNGNVTSMTYDSNGNVLTSTDPLGHVTTKTYNSLNEPLTVQDGNGVTTTNTYDSNGNLTSTSTPVTGTACTCEVVTYNHTNSTDPGDVTSIVDGDSKTTSFGYDTYGDKVETKDPLGNVSGSVYNADGWLTASYTAKAGCTWGSTPPTGCSSTYETQYSYIITGTTVDEFGDVQKVTDPLSHTTKTTYDANRNALTTIDGNGNTTTNAYDLANELCWRLPGGTSSNTCASPPTNARVTDYNLDGTVSDQKDGKGNTILTYGYDPLGRLTSTTDALSNVTTYVLDGDGNVLNKIDPGGSCTGTVSKCTTNTYDADSELKTVSYSDNSSENITSTTYDGDRQRTAMTDGTGSSSWVFDNLHRLTSYTNGNGVMVGYTYNLRNEPLTIVYPGASHTVTYTYDDSARMNSLKDWLSSTTNTFGYDANSNLTTDTLRNGVTDTYGFNAANQETSISDKISTTTIFAATYTRDSNGQLATDSSQTTNQRDYKYTALNQVCYAGSANSNACTSPPTSSYPYAYDNADNLTTMENAAHSGKNTQQFNNADELCWTVAGASANACGTAPTGATTYTYDTKGNRTHIAPSSGAQTCDTYDQANRLTQIQTGTGSTCTTPTTVGAYAYDGDGLRESKTVSGTTTQFVWDGMGGNLLDEKSGSSNPLYYIYGPGGLPVEQIDTSGTAHFYSHDQIGSARAISSATGTSQNTYSYDPYGNVVSSTGSVTNHLKFSGQYQDAESSLYYLRARYYDPTTGCFLAVDPAVAATRSPYAYVAGNPLNKTDPSGLDSSLRNLTGTQCGSFLMTGIYSECAAANYENCSAIIQCMNAMVQSEVDRSELGCLYHLGDNQKLSSTDQAIRKQIASNFAAATAAYNDSGAKFTAECSAAHDPGPLSFIPSCSEGGQSFHNAATQAANGWNNDLHGNAAAAPGIGFALYGFMYTVSSAIAGATG
jgi:RHS repeat-associated protein